MLQPFAVLRRDVLSDRTASAWARLPQQTPRAPRPLPSSGIIRGGDNLYLMRGRHGQGKVHAVTALNAGCDPFVLTRHSAATARRAVDTLSRAPPGGRCSPIGK